eukprot:TRINITY_DN82782_c0_g1_i1.p1 TRINITY_DN82782_c0_g1~~TRINITY_DN82782_c0_g1_i1.p1  ORF type:complete len:296 (-),score=38.39 TRINITY_DN82782_c0_g1_i1:141-1028(-)
MPAIKTKRRSVRRTLAWIVKALASQNKDIRKQNKEIRKLQNGQQALQQGLHDLHRFIDLGLPESVQKHCCGLYALIDDDHYAFFGSAVGFVVMGRDRVFFSAAHNFTGHRAFVKGKEQYFEVAKVFLDRENDLAAFTLHDHSDFAELDAASVDLYGTAKVSLLDPLYLLTAKVGIAAATGRLSSTMEDVWQVDCGLVGGFSGCPCFNGEWKLVAIGKGERMEADGLSHASTRPGESTICSLFRQAGEVVYSSLLNVHRFGTCVPIRRLPAKDTWVWSVFRDGSYQVPSADVAWRA